MFALIALIAIIVIVATVAIDAILAYGLGAGARDMYTIELASRLIRR